MTQAIILAGGMGTRLAGLHPGPPKALAPVAGKPFIQWQIEWLRAGGVSRAHLALGHKSQQIIEWLESTPMAGMEVSFSAEQEPFGTAGALKFCEPDIASEPFLALNGDSLLPNLDFSGFAAAFSRHDSEAMMAVTTTKDAGRFGLVETGGNGFVTGFREKSVSARGVINAGIYIMRRAVLGRIQPQKRVSLETEVFPSMAAAHRLGFFQAAPPLLDMGTPEGIREMEEYLREPRIH